MYYLTHRNSLNYLDVWKKQALGLKYAQYQLIDGFLFQQNYDNILLRCLEKDNVEHILTKLYDGPVGSHFSGETTAHKVLRASYYWCTLFKDAHAHARKCQIFQVNAVEKEDMHSHFNPLLLIIPSSNGDWMWFVRSI